MISQRTPRILVVDDEQYVCDLCSRTLARASYNVTATTDPLGALRLLEDQSFDILLTDIQMPSISGLDLAQRARTIDPALVIIIMTGHASRENLQQAVQRGIADFLNKPFELDDLRLAVDQALHKRSLLQENLRLRAMVQLLSSSDAINATLDLGELSQIIIDGALRESLCTTGVLALVSISGDLSVMRYADTQQEILPAGLDLVQEAFRTGSLQVMNGDQPLLVHRQKTYMSGLALPLNAQGEVVGALLLCADLIDTRSSSYEALNILLNQAGSAIRNAQRHSELQEMYLRLQDLDHMKSEFIAIASHELRTPLSIVLGYTMMVRDQMEGEARAYLQRVLDNAQRIKRIVDDMVSLRYLESDQAQLQLELCDVLEAVVEVYEQLRPAAEEKNQQLHMVLPETQLRCLLDREKFQLTLGHLLANSIKFTAPEGWVELIVGVQPTNPLADRQRGDLAVSSQHQKPDDDGWIVIEVRDNGVGIPSRDHTRIFERFYQVADSLTRDQGGTGLGLAIVKELVTVMGGYLGVTSEPGQGSIFSLVLPIYRRIEQY